MEQVCKNFPKWPSAITQEQIELIKAGLNHCLHKVIKELKWKHTTHVDGGVEVYQCLSEDTRYLLVWP